tara:strand:+ start:1216 stop:1737 length:522 start_codon:yes stop_codon:yes gene_type:complete
MAINFATGGTQSRPAGITNNEYFENYTSRWLYSSPSGAWRTGPGNLGNGTINLTSTDSASRHLVTVHMNFGHIDTWTQPAFLVQYRIGSGSWSNIGGAGQILWLSGRHGAHGVASLQHLWWPNSTSNVAYRIKFTSQNSGDYIRLNYGNLSGGYDNGSEQSPTSSVLIQEYRV